MTGTISQHCPTCHRTTRLLAGPATWGCACGITYTAHEAPDGTVSVYWAQEGRSDLLFAARVEVTFPARKQVVLSDGRKQPRARKGAST